MQILAGIVLLGVLIAFHELGHFLFAKWLKVRVLVFSLGFGPKLLSFKRGDTEYRLSAIPLGGYVRMFGESLEEDLSPEEKRLSFMHQATWRKSLIAVAGPLFNFILPVILFFALLIGSEQVFAPVVGTLLEGGVAEKAGLLPHDLIISVDEKPVASFNEVADLIAKNPNVDLVLQVERRGADGSKKQMAITVRPEEKLIKNPLESEAVGRIGIMPAIEAPFIVVSEESSLKKVGLKSFDEIIKIDHQAISSSKDLFSALKTLVPGSLISIKRKNAAQVAEEIQLSVPADMALTVNTWAPGSNDAQASDEMKLSIEKTNAILKEERELLVKHFGIASASGAIVELFKDSMADKLGLAVEDRIIAVDGEKLVGSVQLEQAIMHDAKRAHVLGVIKKNGDPISLTFSPDASLLEKVDLNTDILKVFGVSLYQVLRPGQMIERQVGPLEALSRSFKQTYQIAAMTAKSLWLLVKGDVPASQLGGPIMLFDVAQQAAHKGLAYYISIMCLLSVNLGLLNLLPIPGLDGGHLLMFGIEAVQRKPLTSRTRAIATQIGIVILLLVMALAIFNDLTRLFS